MSQFSKVNPSLRQQIVEFLKSQGTAFSSNGLIQSSIPSCYSLRAIQEATQKMTADGTLVRNGNKFSLAANSTGTSTIAAAASN